MPMTQTDSQSADAPREPRIIPAVITYERGIIEILRARRAAKREAKS